MTMTPIKQQALKARDFSAINTTPQPWSRSRPDRFGGYGSQYVKDPAAASTPGAAASPRRATYKSFTTTTTTPAKTPAKTERYATPAERALTPSATKPDPTFSSATDRFALPSSVYSKSASATPGVGAYELSDEALAARVRGAVKLQAAVRRRQSRGVFATERFTGHGTIHSASTHRRGSALPGVGDYTPEEPREQQKGGGAVSAFKGGHEDRFARHDSIYVAPASEEHSLHQPVPMPSWANAAATAPTLPKRDEPSAAFAPAANGGHVDRFNTIGSIYHASTSAATPGVGAYDISGERTMKEVTAEARLMGERPAGAAFASATDRFGAALPGSLYARSDAPGVNTYDVPDAGMAARVRGATKLQAAVRRRQSNAGVAVSRTQQAQQTTSKAETTTEPPKSLEPATPASPPSLPAAPLQSDHADDARAPLAAALSMADETSEEATTSEVAHQTAEGATEEATTPEARGSWSAVARRANSITEAVAEIADVATAAAAAAEAELLATGGEEAEEEGYVPFAAEATALEEMALEPSPCGAIAITMKSKSMPRLSHVVSLDAWLGDMDAEEEDGEAAAVATAEAAEAARTAEVAAKEHEQEAETGDVVEEEDAADGEWLFSQLVRISPEAVDASDYFSEGNGGWDLAGLRSDLAIYMAQEVAA